MNVSEKIICVRLITAVPHEDLGIESGQTTHIWQLPADFADKAKSCLDYS